MMIAKSTWVKNFQSVVDNGRTHSLVVDLPPGKNGDDFGPTALELANMALAGCISTIFAVVAGKMRLNIQTLEVTVDSSKPDDAPTITKSDILLKIKTSDSEDKVNRCFEQTMKMCPVGVIFSNAGIETNHRIELV